MPFGHDTTSSKPRTYVLNAEPYLVMTTPVLVAVEQHRTILGNDPIHYDALTITRTIVGYDLSHRMSPLVRSIPIGYDHSDGDAVRPNSERT